MTDTDPTNPTIAGVLPAAARRVVYALLGFAVPTVLVTVAALSDGWQWADLGLILPTAAATSGFPLALSNTPRT